jgi:hypothetical protein
MATLQFNTLALPVPHLCAIAIPRFATGIATDITFRILITLHFTGA